MLNSVKWICSKYKKITLRGQCIECLHQTEAIMLTLLTVVKLTKFYFFSTFNTKFIFIVYAIYSSAPRFQQCEAAEEEITCIN